MDPGAVGPMVGISVISLSVAAVLILRGPLGRALGKRLEGTGASDLDLVQRVEELESRLLAAEQAEGRVADLEERLDFAERLLAKETRSPHIEGGR